MRRAMIFYSLSEMYYVAEYVAEGRLSRLCFILNIFSMIFGMFGINMESNLAPLNLTDILKKIYVYTYTKNIKPLILCCDI